MRSFDERIAEINRRSQQILKKRRQRRRLLVACIPPVLLIVLWGAGLRPFAAPPVATEAENVALSEQDSSHQIVFTQLRVTGGGLQLTCEEPQRVEQVAALLDACFVQEEQEPESFLGHPAQTEASEASEENTLRDHEDAYDLAVSPETYRLVLVTGESLREYSLQGSTLLELQTGRVVSLTPEQLEQLRSLLEITERSEPK